MKQVKSILKIFLTILFIIITMSFAVENIITKTIAENLVAKKISGYILDEVIYNFDIDTLGKIEDKVRNSKYIQEITAKYLDILISNCINNENKEFNINNEINKILDKELDEYLSPEKKKEIMNYVGKQGTRISEILQKNVSDGFDTYNFRGYFETYNVITSPVTRILILIFITADIVLLIILEKKKALKAIKNSLIIIAIITAICAILIKLGTRFIGQHYTGGWIDNININILIYLFIAEIIISGIIYFIWRDKKMIKLVLVRHGQSMWNLENKFTGWTDVELSEKGIEEAKEAGKVLKEKGFEFDLAYTSVLKRAEDTLDYILDEMGEKNIEIKRSWRLNERHYGALQGLNKDETREKYGAEQVLLWRRSADVRPPELDEKDPRYPGNDPKYKELTKGELPKTENLIDTIKRVVEYWNSDIKPELQKGKKIIIAAHGNSLRGLIKYLDNMSDEDVIKLELQTGNPICYELDENLKPIKHYYLK